MGLVERIRMRYSPCRMVPEETSGQRFGIACIDETRQGEPDMKKPRTLAHWKGKTLAEKLKGKINELEPEPEPLTHDGRFEEIERLQSELWDGRDLNSIKN
jgi:hypothetical protein